MDKILALSINFGC